MSRYKQTLPRRVTRKHAGERRHLSLQAPRVARFVQLCREAAANIIATRTRVFNVADREGIHERVLQWAKSDGRIVTGATHAIRFTISSAVIHKSQPTE